MKIDIIINKKRLFMENIDFLNKWPSSPTKKDEANVNSLIYSHSMFPNKANELQQKSTELFKKLYFDILPSLSKESKERNYAVISSSKKLQNILNPELGEIRKNKESGNTVLKAVEKARLAAKLGIKPKLINEGMHESYLYSSIKGKELGIFKPDNEISWGESWYVSAKQTVWGSQRAYLNRYKGSEPEHEYAASLIAKYLGINVPDTGIVDLGSKHGSFMRWVLDAKDCHSVGQEILEKRINRERAHRFPENGSF